MSEQVLRFYADTHEGRFRQGIPGVVDLEKAGLLQWHGRQHGVSFYSITDAGKAALTSTKDSTP